VCKYALLKAQFAHSTCIRSTPQEVDLPSFVEGLRQNLPDGDKRWMSNDLAASDRILFLDGTIQSIHSSEATYHEALVHPVMFAHDGPTSVAVLGGGEGATIREVLKHSTVESVTMIDIDGEFIDIARKYLPKMNDCSDLVGRAANCFDDEAVMLVLENGIKYFLDLQGPEQLNKPKPFDVVIVDALDPEENLEFVKDFYVDDAFLSAMLASMSEKGVLVIQIGTAPELSDPKPDVGMYQVRERLFNLFEAHSEVAAMFVYEEPKSGFLEPHSFLVVCKDSTCRNRWYSRSDAIDYEIYKRIIPTKSGEPALKFYDGANQHIYQATPKAWETVYCRREPTPFECTYVSLDFSAEIHELSLLGESSFTLDLRKNESGDIVDASVFAKADIPKGSLIMPSDLSMPLLLGERSIDAINSHVEDSTVYREFASFVDSWAHDSCAESTDTRFLEVGASTLIRKVSSGGENVGRWVPRHPTGKRPIFSPVYDRHRISFEVFLVALEDIPAGFELLRSKNEWSC
jgi:spermidine synthase